MQEAMVCCVCAHVCVCVPQNRGTRDHIFQVTRAVTGARTQSREGTKEGSVSMHGTSLQ